jgi:hypothetical protein
MLVTGLPSSVPGIITSPLIPVVIVVALLEPEPPVPIDTVWLGKIPIIV